MVGLTGEAKEEHDLWMRFRLNLASFVIGLGFTIMPEPFWDSVQEEELKQMAKRFDLEVVRCVETGTEQNGGA